MGGTAGRQNIPRGLHESRGSRSNRTPIRSLFLAERFQLVKGKGVSLNDKRERSHGLASKLFPSVWGYLAGAILLAAGIGLVLNKQSRIAAASIGALMTLLTLLPYLLILILAHGGSTPEITEALNYVADTLLFAGAALVLASALPRGPDRVEKKLRPRLQDRN